MSSISPLAMKGMRTVRALKSVLNGPTLFGEGSQMSKVTKVLPVERSSNIRAMLRFVDTTKSALRPASRTNVRNVPRLLPKNLKMKKASTSS